MGRARTAPHLYLGYWIAGPPQDGLQAPLPARWKPSTAAAGTTSAEAPGRASAPPVATPDHPRPTIAPEILHAPATAFRPRLCALLAATLAGCVESTSRAIRAWPSRCATSRRYGSRPTTPRCTTTQTGGLIRAPGRRRRQRAQDRRGAAARASRPGAAQRVRLRRRPARRRPVPARLPGSRPARRRRTAALSPTATSRRSTPACPADWTWTATAKSAAPACPATRGNDAWGYGLHPGPVRHAGAVAVSDRCGTGAHVPAVEVERDARRAPAASIPRSGQPWYATAIWSQLRLSSKSHWDVPVRTPGGTVHLLASHPTPPVFDGPENRNGARNADEIAAVAGIPRRRATSRGCATTTGRCGGLAADARFVIARRPQQRPGRRRWRARGDHRAARAPARAALRDPAQRRCGRSGRSVRAGRARATRRSGACHRRLRSEGRHDAAGLRAAVGRLRRRRQRRVLAGRRPTRGRHRRRQRPPPGVGRSAQPGALHGARIGSVRRHPAQAGSSSDLKVAEVDSAYAGMTG